VARRGVALARSAYVPSVGASVSYQWQDTDLGGSEDGVALGLNWSWDVWDWGQRRSAVRGAEATSRAARLGYEDERSRVVLEVERLWLALRLAARTIEVAKKDWDYAIENVRVSREKYEAGTLLITDLLDDQTALNDARIAYHVAVYDYAIALADLRRAMGER
jgi:outer membrane protein TolC